MPPRWASPLEPLRTPAVLRLPPVTANSVAGVTALKVALVAPSATNDLAFTQSMYSALQSLKKSENLTISVSANEYVVSDAASIIREYASEGYNLIIAHGSQYGSTIEQLAPQFPKVSFAWGTAGATFGLKNVFAYEASSNEGGYVQGYMAALISKSKVLGICGPIATGDAKLYVDGFCRRGCCRQGQQIQGNRARVYTGSFSDDSLMATCREDLRARRQGGRAHWQLAICRWCDRCRRSRTTSHGSVRSGTSPLSRRRTSSPRRFTTGSRSCSRCSRPSAVARSVARPT